MSTLLFRDDNRQPAPLLFYGPTHVVEATTTSQAWPVPQDVRLVQIRAVTRPIHVASGAAGVTVAAPTTGSPGGFLIAPEDGPLDWPLRAGETHIAIIADAATDVRLTERR
jgi:hypothetical protein